MAVFKVSELYKKFGKFSALNGVNLELNAGEVLGFLGPNGAGKSTTIRILLGMLKKTSGDVQILGQDPFKDAAKVHQDLVYVPGEVNIWASLTGGETIDFLAKLSRVNTSTSEYVQTKDHWVQRFELDVKKKAKSYSKGNKQKVALVAAIVIAKVKDVQLLIFDEPTSGLDPLMEEVFVKAVGEFKNAGKAIFLSSHILSEVEKLCDRVAIIKEGHIIKEGTVEQIRQAHGENETLESAFLESYE